MAMCPYLRNGVTSYPFPFAYMSENSWFCKLMGWVTLVVGKHTFTNTHKAMLPYQGTSVKCGP